MAAEASSRGRRCRCTGKLLSRVDVITCMAVTPTPGTTVVTCAATRVTQVHRDPRSNPNRRPGTDYYDEYDQDEYTDDDYYEDKASEYRRGYQNGKGGNLSQHKGSSKGAGASAAPARRQHGSYSSSRTSDAGSTRRGGNNSRGGKSRHGHNNNNNNKRSKSREGFCRRFWHDVVVERDLEAILIVVLAGVLLLFLL